MMYRVLGYICVTLTPRSRSNIEFLVNASPPKAFDVVTSISVGA